MLQNLKKDKYFVIIKLSHLINNNLGRRKWIYRAYLFVVTHKTPQIRKIIISFRKLYIVGIKKYNTYKKQEISYYWIILLVGVSCHVFKIS